jgi:4-amino-4-deoxy-L-arabinose transferase-like glycosyltransferase
VLLLVAGFLFSQELNDRTNYDEGVYLASLDDLRHGDQLGRDVFASQPPGFYVLLRFIALFTGRSIEGIRIGTLVIGLIGVAAAFVIGRVLAGRAGAVAVAALVIAAPPFASEAARVQADAPSIALTLVAVAIAASSFRPNAVWGPLAAGVFASLSISVKFLAVPVLVPLALLAWQRRIGVRGLAAGAAGALVVSGALAIAYAPVLPELWRDAVEFQRVSGPLPEGEPAGRRLIHYFAARTPTTWAAAAGAVAGLALRRQFALWAWAGAAVAFLALQAPLLDHHFVLLAAAMATAAGASLGSVPRRLAPVAFACAGVIALGGWIQDYRQIHRSRRPEPSDVRTAANLVRTLTKPDARVASDLPIVPYLADRRVPGALVDTSALRFASGSLKPQDIRRSNASVYVAGREFLRYPATIRGLSLVTKVGGIEILRRP